MKVSRWGNSLAIRLSADMIEELDVDVGDEVDVKVRGTGQLDVAKSNRVQDAIEQLKALSRALPDDWEFDRDQANAH